MQQIKIALSKGGLLQGAVDFFKSKGIELEDNESTKRKLIRRGIIHNEELKDYEIQFLLVRGHDVPVYVEHGAADFGIVGLDVVLDSQAKVHQLMDLKYGACDLCVCSINGKYKNIAEIPSYARIATTFPNLSKEFFTKRGLEVEIIKLYGSVELAPLTDLTDIIIDLVATGKTLKENGLEPIHTIMHCTSHLIANRSSFEFTKDFFNKLNQESLVG
ncbi:MAG: ATP phosphoribosyltransferase [Candidatus Caenarcaniphilales bacterium]|nr:ATP phosphoribosyltransferase [Candidatus Caenarcaniphilales bacterium]